MRYRLVRRFAAPPRAARPAPPPAPPAPPTAAPPPAPPAPPTAAQLGNPYSRCFGRARSREELRRARQEPSK